MAKPKCISLKALKLHEFWTTLRYMNKDGQSWVAKTELCNEIQEKAIKSFLKAAGQLLIAYLAATSLRNGDNISLTIADFEAAVPAAYFLFVSSSILFATALAFNHLSTAITLKSSLAGKITLSGFSANAYDVIHLRSENALGLPVFTNNFIKERLPISGAMSAVFLMMVFVLLMPIGASGYYVFAELLQLGQNAQIPLVERATAIAGVVATVIAGLSVLLFHVPLPVKKDTGSIRWLFLYRLPPHPSDQEKFRRWSTK